MIRLLLLFVLTKSILFGCAICTIYSPVTRISVEVDANKDFIKTAKITWILTKEFTDQLKQIYDVNLNKKLDKKELEVIEQSLLDYIVPKNYLTHISYDKIIDKKNSKKIVVNKYNTYIKSSLLHFDYKIELNYRVIPDNALYLNIKDDEDYFIFIFIKDNVTFNSSIKVSKVIDQQSAVFYINSDVEIGKIEELKEIKKEKLKDEIVIKEKKTEEVKKEEPTLLYTFSQKVKEYLLKIENGDNFALFTLLFISFVYGVIHALGPGHGKSLAFSYFVSNKSSYFKAFIISQLSAFIHILGALILVVVSVFVLQSLLNNFVNESVEILTKLSAILIIALALFILYNKLKNKSCACSSCTSSLSSDISWSTKKPIKTKKIKKSFFKQDLYFVLTAGLIPCPGTVVLFIYAFVLKTYLAVFLASVFISIGMGLVIFASSFFGITLSKVSSKSHTITNALEILAPIFMLILGVLLFFNANMV